MGRQSETLTQAIKLSREIASTKILALVPHSARTILARDSLSNFALHSPDLLSLGQKYPSRLSV